MREASCLETRTEVNAEDPQLLASNWVLKRREGSRVRTTGGEAEGEIGRRRVATGCSKCWMEGPGKQLFLLLHPNILPFVAAGGSPILSGANSLRKGAVSLKASFLENGSPWGEDKEEERLEKEEAAAIFYLLYK